MLVSQKTGVLLSAAAGILLAAGCAPELSKTQGISIKRAYRQWGGQSVDEHGTFHQHTQRIPDVLQNMHRFERVVSTVDLSAQYDFAIPPAQPEGTSAAGPAPLKAEQALRLQMRAFDETFGLSVKIEVRKMPVYVLVRREDVPLALDICESPGHPRCHTSPVFICCRNPIEVIVDAFRPYQPAVASFQSFSLSDLADWLERRYEVVVVNETELEGHYDFSLVQDVRNRITFRDSLRKLGLDLQETRRPVRAIYIDKKPDARPAVPLKELQDDFQVYPAWERPTPPMNDPGAKERNLDAPE